MRARLYGGAGHGRMVYLPNSTVAPPPTLTMPVLTPGEFAKLWPLDPELPGDNVLVSYRDTGRDDDDGYRIYDWIPVAEEGGHMAEHDTHPYQPSTELTHAMRTDPLCAVCGQRRNDPIHQ